MGAVSSAVQSQQQSTLNSITQSSSAACAANCTQIQSGNTIFITGSNTGNITFDQTCTVNAKCQIDNSVDAAATALQSAISDASAKPGFFLGLAQVNSTVQISQQDLVNQIHQALDSTCNNGSTQIQSANLIYVQNSTTKDIGFNQNTDVTSQCVLSNLAKGTAQSTQKADATAQSGGLGGAAIAGILTIVIVVVVIIAIVSINKKKKDDQAKQQQQGGGGGGSKAQNAALAGFSTPGPPQVKGAVAAANYAGVKIP